jgi:hypothetical protein
VIWQEQGCLLLALMAQGANNKRKVADRAQAIIKARQAGMGE